MLPARAALRAAPPKRSEVVDDLVLPSTWCSRPNHGSHAKAPQGAAFLGWQGKPMRAACLGQNGAAEPGWRFFPLRYENARHIALRSDRIQAAPRRRLRSFPSKGEQGGKGRFHWGLRVAFFGEVLPWEFN